MNAVSPDEIQYNSSHKPKSLQKKVYSDISSNNSGMKFRKTDQGNS